MKEMQQLIKDSIVNSSMKTYDQSILLDEQDDKSYDLLSLLSIENLNIEKNLIRNLDFNTTYSVDTQTDKIIETLKSYDHLEIVKEFSTKVINKWMNIMFIHSKVEEFHQEILEMGKSGELKRLYKQSLENCNTFDMKNLDPLIKIFSDALQSDYLSSIFQMLNLTRISEFATILSCEHNIIFIVGIKVYLPYMFCMYKEGFFTYFLKEVILKLNFRQAKVLYFKPSYLIPTGAIVVCGLLFHFGADGKLLNKMLHRMRELKMFSNNPEKLNFDLKDYLPTGSTKEIIAAISRSGNQLGYAMVKIGGSVLKGVMIGVADNVREVYQILVPNGNK